MQRNLLKQNFCVFGLDAGANGKHRFPSDLNKLLRYVSCEILFRMKKNNKKKCFIQLISSAFTENVHEARDAKAKQQQHSKKKKTEGQR